MTNADLRDAVASLTWFHSMELAEGVITPGKKSRELLTAEADAVFRYFDPAYTVLDIGAWDGFFSFEARRRGGQRVLATDRFCWKGGGPGQKGAFDLARSALGLNVEEQLIDPMDLTVDSAGTFDCILFLGVLYHLSLFQCKMMLKPGRVSNAR